MQQARQWTHEYNSHHEHVLYSSDGDGAMLDSKDINQYCDK